MKIIEFCARIMKIMKIVEIHERITKVMKFLEFNARIMKIINNVIIPLEINEKLIKS